MTNWTKAIAATTLALALAGCGDASGAKTDDGASPDKPAAGSTGKLDKAAGCQSAIKLQKELSTTLKSGGAEAAYKSGATGYGELAGKVDDQPLAAALTAVSKVSETSAAALASGGQADLDGNAKAYANL